MTRQPKMDAVNIEVQMDGVNLNKPDKRTAGQMHGDLRTALLIEGVALLDHGGIESGTFRAVARNAEVGHPAQANHFPSRSAMLTAFAAMIFAELADMSVAAVAGMDDQPEQALQAFADTWFQFAFD